MEAGGLGGIRLIRQDVFTRSDQVQVIPNLAESTVLRSNLPPATFTLCLALIRTQTEPRNSRLGPPFHPL